LPCYIQALEIYEKVGDEQNQTEQLKNIRSAYRGLGFMNEAWRFGARLKEIERKGGKPGTEDLVEKFGSKGLDPFHEEYWRATREEDIKKYWSEYYQSHLRG
jgi:hypothetical protein